MPQTSVFPGLTEKRLRALQQDAFTKRQFQRVQCLYLRQHGASSKDISAVLALSSVSVKRVWRDYRRRGEAGILQDRRGGRYRQNMTEKEEHEFLDPFLKKASSGGVLIAREIQQAYEKKLQRPIPKSTIYAMLHRHGWRKIVPRPSHPKGNESTREIFRVSFPPDRSMGSNRG